MTAALAIARCRALWPAVTVSAASDDFLEAWYTHATQEAGESFFGADQLDAVAHLLAHAAYKVDPAGELGSHPGATGPLTSLRTLDMAATWSAPGAGAASATDADLATTKPGQMYRALRDRQLATAPRVVVPFGI